MHRRGLNGLLLFHLVELARPDLVTISEGQAANTMGRLTTAINSYNISTKHAPIYSEKRDATQSSEARRTQAKPSHGLEDFRNGDRPGNTPAALNFFGTVDFVPSLELHCRSLVKRVIATSNQSREPHHQHGTRPNGAVSKLSGYNAGTT